MKINILYFSIIGRKLVLFFFFVMSFINFRILWFFLFKLLFVKSINYRVSVSTFFYTRVSHKRTMRIIIFFFFIDSFIMTFFLPLFYTQDFPNREIRHHDPKTFIPYEKQLSFWFKYYSGA